METSQNPLHLLRYIFNFSYYTGGVPYRFKFSPSFNKYTIVQNKWQKITCIVFSVLYSLEMIMYFREFVPYAERNVTGEMYSPTTYFKFAIYSSNMFFFLIVLAKHWSRSREYLDVINMLHDTHGHFRDSMQIHYQPLLLTALAIVATFVHLVSYLTEFVPPTNRSVYGTMDAMREDAMSLFFLDRWKDATKTPFRTLVLGILRLIVLYSFSIFGTFEVMLSINCTICLNKCLDSFISILNRKDSQVLQIYAEFNGLQSVTQLLNEACGILILGITMGSLPYFVYCFVEMISSSSTEFPNYIYQLLDTILVYGFIIYAANINRKAVYVSERFIHQHDLSCLTQYQLQRLLREISENRIGISGAGYFTITCQFLGSLVGLIFTFSVILIQFKSAQTLSLFPSPIPTMAD